jgi:2-dehydro-3-deoxygluconokinase
LSDASLLAGTRLCVVGNVNRDVRLSPIDPNPRLFEDGETSTQSVRETIGGGGANSAVAAAALGARVTFIGKTGADGLGDRLERTLAARGVETNLVRDADHPSGTSINLVWTSGRRHFVSCLPASHALAFEDVDLTALRGCDHLLRADPWFAEPMLLHGGNFRLAQAARDAGVAVSLDINCDPQAARASPEIAERRKVALREMLPLVDLAHGNVAELCTFADAATLDEALNKLAARGVGATVVHMGEQGAGYFTAGEFTVEPCVPAARTVNTTGTGDVLSVCMMLLHKHADVPIREKLRFANRTVADYIAGTLDLVAVLV